MSSVTNLDKFISLNVLINNNSSSGVPLPSYLLISSSSLKMLPAVLNTDKIFLNPKS